jgi:hypothetical protein
MKKMVIKKIEYKSIVWFKNSNSYLIFEPLIAEILSKIDTKISLTKIEDWCSKKLEDPKEIITEFIANTFEVYKENNILTPKKETTVDEIVVPILFFSEKHYSIHNYIFKIQYQNKYHASKIHPTFAHLEINESSSHNFMYTIFDNNESLVFLKDTTFIGQWDKSDSHVFEGKISMQILIDIYKKPETDWMGVFHASAISNGKESMLFLGDSGNGKSTSLALLSANGFDCIADDFVPIDIKKNVHTYPAAISIKKKGVSTLLPYYPELENSTEYHFKKLHKTVRFLPPKAIDYRKKLKCKALVFIKYNPDIEIDIHPISQIDAFQQLVPDSWISPLEKNATLFLDWFLDLPCYQLTYSNNEKMIDTVSKIFNNEL